MLGRHSRLHVYNFSLIHLTGLIISDFLRVFLFCTNQLWCYGTCYWLKWNLGNLPYLSLTLINQYSVFKYSSDSTWGTWAHHTNDLHFVHWGPHHAWDFGAQLKHDEENEKCTSTIWGVKYLFSLFNRTALLVQESVLSSKCCILDNMMFWSQMLYYQAFSKIWSILM
jgi:hypothetical protein